MTAIDTLLHEPAIRAVGWALLHFLWQGSLVCVVAALALRALRGSAADVRYVVAAIALSIMATIPAVTGVQVWRAARASSSAAIVDVAGLPAEAAGPAALPAVTIVAAAAPEPIAERAAQWISLGRLEQWLPTLVLLWMAGVAILALRLGGGWLRVQRMRAHGATPAAAPLQAIVARLTRRLHISRTVSLLQSAAVDVPTVIGWLKPTVLLPVSVLAGLSPQQVEAILAHELAHVRRHDYLVNLLQTFVETLLFYHPGVWWLSRRIRIEREHCCDDLAVSLCGDPVVYARALADLEELRGPGRLAMAANGGALLDRVRRLLAAPAAHEGRGPAWLAAAGALLLVLAIIGGAIGRQPLAASTLPVPGASPEAPSAGLGPVGPIADVAIRTESSEQRPPKPPAPPAPAPAPPAPPSPPSSATAAASSELSATQNESSGNYTWSNNGEKLSVNYRGAFTLNDTDDDIVRMSPGSSLKISDGKWLSSHSVQFTADASGNITRRFYVGSSERSFDPEGRQWLSKVLPRFVRQSAFGAKERVARFLASGGVPALLAEITKIEGSYAKKVYFTQLIAQAPLDPATARRVLEQIGREIDSNYELATTLIGAAPKILIDDATRKAYLDAARQIESDYEMRRVFDALVRRGTQSPELIAGVLDASRSLESDYEAATLLLEIVNRYPVDGVTRDPFFRALQTVDSSYEKGRVLQALLRRGELPDATLLAALREAGSIDSDHETAQVLLAAARSQALAGAAREAYVSAAERLGNYERDRTLAALARTGR